VSRRISTSTPARPRHAPTGATDPAVERPDDEVRVSRRSIRSIRRHDVVAVVGPWLVGRVLVVAAIGAVHQLRDHFTVVGTPVHTVGLFGWDASYYSAIARHGYAAVETRQMSDGLRFFPLYPLFGRLLGGSNFALLSITSISMLVAIVLVRELARRWTDERTADTAAWIWAIGPGALASVMAYAEPLFVVLACVVFLALEQVGERDRATGRDALWIGVAAVAGGLAALTRPVGLVLVVVVAMYAWQRRRPLMLLAMAGPIAGLGSFLWWAGGLEPLTLQKKANLRGQFVDPFRAVAGALRDSIRDHRTGPVLHVGWVALAIALIIIGARTLPPAATAYAAVSVAVALTSYNLDSFERYLFAAFPIAIAGALIVRRRPVEYAVIATLAGALVAYSVLAFTTTYIP
jgi:hypothetical protein